MTNSSTAATRKSASKQPPRKAAPRKATKRPNAKTPATDKITVHISEFEKAIARVKPFAGTDETLPSINAVALQLRDRVLTVVATNRFILGASVITPVLFDDDTLPPDFEVVIRLVDLPLLAAVLKRSDARAVGRIELQVKDGQIVVDGVRFGDTNLPDKYPHWRRLVAAAEQRVAAGPPDFSEIVVNPEYLRKFTQIKPTPKLHVTAPSKPILAVSDDFIGIIMPVRVVEDRATTLARFGINVDADAKSEVAA